jgi:hypothetical protein
MNKYYDYTGGVGRYIQFALLLEVCQEVHSMSSLHAKQVYKTGFTSRKLA